MENHKLIFEVVRNQNNCRVHYHIHKLNVKDLDQEIYQEGLVAMWNSYERCHPDNGIIATYFNYVVCNRIVDLKRKLKRTKKGIIV
ncbi:sigma-70 family RNA polymerase sigma factor [Virgibacillus oceani]|uniref:RNA polymerase sigma-70 region 2 domain-containing protein n=1 Tax=Virgibacillus oceani TaxID=1479511 RepID=A0A917M684_9BACI|nr:sigma-70 family RNA polymerase sigma factor [Virgibacillus oceani]GGG79920.1 hypothetical protein GCM10011398_26570 [Virgibacillus oceani]